MNSMDMIRENIRVAETAKVGELTEQDLEMFAQVRSAINEKIKVPCTGCGYCQPCPFGVDIPRSFSMMNDYAKYNNERSLVSRWKEMDEGARADQCKSCGKCETACPQALPIREKLHEIAARMNA